METIWPTSNDVFLTCLRWSVGLSTGTLLGLLVASLEALAIPNTQRQARRRAWVIAALLDFLRALPVIALVPIIQMFGVEEWWKISLIAWAVMFPVWISIRQARTRRMLDTELTLSASGLRPLEIFWNYRFPKALGGLLRGVEISIGVAWISVVAAEWVGTFSNGFWAGGLGYKVLKAHDANNWSGMLACLALFGVLGSGTAWLWRALLSKDRELVAGFNPMGEYGD